MKNFISASILLFCCATISVAQTIPSYVPTSGLVGWWPFNGNATDESVNTNDGAVNGASLTMDRFGVANSAYSFNGLSNYIQVPSNSQLSFTSAYSISSWVNFNAFNSGGFPFQPAIVSKISGGDWYGGYELRGISDASGIPKNINTAGNIGGGNVALNKSGLNINQWYNAIVTYNGIKMKLYIDGFCFDSLSITGSLQTSSIPLRFGRRGGGPSYDCWLNGKIDDIGLWNRALTTCEVKQLYMASLSTFTINTISSSPVICSGQTTTLTASGANSYTWQPMSIVNSSIVVTPITSALFTVVATSTAGCVESKTISLLISPLPTITVSSDTICTGETFTITPSGASTYTYSSGSAVVSPTLTTTYSVTGTSTLGCVSQSPTSLTVFVSPCTSIDELDNNQYIIFYPNPFTNEIYVKVEGEIRNKKYLIYNASGQVIQTGILNANKINCSDFSKGLYFIKLGGSAKAFRLMKEN
jgi:hypothetical protein